MLGVKLAMKTEKQWIGLVATTFFSDCGGEIGLNNRFVSSFFLMKK